MGFTGRAVLDFASGSYPETLFGSLVGFHFIHCFTVLYAKTSGQSLINRPVWNREFYWQSPRVQRAFCQFTVVLGQREEIFSVSCLDCVENGLGSWLDQVFAHVMLIEHRHTFGPNMKLACKKRDFPMPHDPLIGNRAGVRDRMLAKILLDPRADPRGQIVVAMGNPRSNVVGTLALNLSA